MWFANATNAASRVSFCRTASERIDCSVLAETSRHTTAFLNTTNACLSTLGTIPNVASNAGNNDSVRMMETAVLMQTISPNLLKSGISALVSTSADPPVVIAECKIGTLHGTPNNH